MQRDCKGDLDVLQQSGAMMEHFGMVLDVIKIEQRSEIVRRAMVPLGLPKGLIVWRVCVRFVILEVFARPLPG